MKKKLLITFAVIISIFVTSAVAIALIPKNSSKPAIGVTYEQAVRDGKPFVAFFYTTWCSYCERFMPKYQTLTDYYKGQYDFVMINVEDPKNQGLVEDYAINSFPALYIIDPSINNRVSLYSGIYDDLNKIRLELDRYLRVRSMIKP